jgi:hypothetical protein
MNLPSDFATVKQPRPVLDVKSQDVVIALADWLKIGEDQGVLGDIEKRVQMGAEKYGKRLNSHNGRSALVDLYQELLDGVNYAYQLKLEGLDDGMLCKKLLKIAGGVRRRIISQQNKEA